MTTLEYNQAKFTITSACNQTGLRPADLVGVLSAVLDEAREQMCFELAGDLLGAQEQISNLQKEVDDARNSDAKGSEA